MTCPAFLEISFRTEKGPMRDMLFGAIFPARKFAKIRINFPKDKFLTVQIVELELNFMDLLTMKLDRLKWSIIQGNHTSLQGPYDF